ncbi:hypothetical protein SBF1_3680003 [Candidatus Desulfosporosinus infrequens]|uniref:FeoB-associated Cys-rich membrane protein n=1 Tax=Candidatus Desulfosporosinus infrequens TaxID=2043169 RepID=A0A2U3L4F0_9FIRM|nr:hypothetical protein SBF1_3680003 [Candidatus Desulfosporosinus infrequens]
MCKCKVSSDKKLRKIEIELALIIVLLLVIICELKEWEESIGCDGCESCNASKEPQECEVE